MIISKSDIARSDTSPLAFHVRAFFPTNRSKQSMIELDVQPFKNFQGVKVNLCLYECLGWAKLKRSQSYRRSSIDWWYIQSTLSNLKERARLLHEYAQSCDKSPDISAFYTEWIERYLKYIGMLLTQR